MSMVVFSRTLRDRRRFLFWWCLGMALFVVSQVSFYPSLKQSDALRQYMEEAPEWMKMFTGGEVDIVSPVGYMNSQFFYLMLPLLLFIITIGLCSDALAGEEARGTMDLLLSAPISRRRLLLERWAASAFLTMFISAAFLVTALLMAAAVGMDIGYVKMAEATFNAFLLSLLVGTFSLWVGAATGNRGLSIALGSLLALASYLLDSLGLMVSSLAPWRKISVYYYYSANNALARGLKASHVLVLLGGVAALLLLSLDSFQGREIGVRGSYSLPLLHRLRAGQSASGDAGNQ